MKMDDIQIGDILRSKSYKGDEILIVIGKSFDVTRYGSCYITTEVVKSPFYGKGKEKIFTTLGLLRGIEKIA